MKTEDIYKGIELAQTRQELSQHLDKLEQAIADEQCNYMAEDWLAIARAVDLRNSDFKKRIFH